MSIEDIFPTKPLKRAGAPKGNNNAKKREPRNQDVNLKLSVKEKLNIQGRAERMGCPVNTYIRWKLGLDKKKPL